MDTTLDYHGREQQLARRSCAYFIAEHLHFGWYPRVSLSPTQQAWLTQLEASGPGAVVTLRGEEAALKWPVTGFLLHRLLYAESPQRLAVVAPQQWQANRRYQQLLYPLDKLTADLRPPETVVRTSQVLELATGHRIQAFRAEHLAELRAYAPTLLLLEPGAEALALGSEAGVQLIRLQAPE